jgi:cytochrome c biogenesis protein
MQEEHRQPSNLRDGFSRVLNALASLELTVLAIVVLVLLALAGAWIPQQGSIDEQALLSKYGTEGLALLRNSGLSNVYQSIPFLSAVALLFVNLAACTVARMAPRIKLRVHNEDYYASEQISNFSEHHELNLSMPVQEALSFSRKIMNELGYEVHEREGKLILEKGRTGWLAAPVTHLGLFILLAGVSISAITSYSGSVDLIEGQQAFINENVDRKPLFGKIEALNLKLVSTKREDNKDGSPKQWYSSLAVLNKKSEPEASAEISVNNPWTYKNVDFCQSDWKIAGIRIKLDGEEMTVPLEEAGHDSMGVLPITNDLLLIFALKDAHSPLRLYFKHAESNMPRLFGTLSIGETTKDCPVPVSYGGTLLKSGIQFKCDPGLPVTYCAFLVLMFGAIFVASPSLRIWAAAVPASASAGSQITIGFNELKAGAIMRRDLRLLMRKLEAETAKQSRGRIEMEVSSLDS